MKALRIMFAVLIAVILAPRSFAEVIWVVGPGNTLVSFDHTAPGTPLSTVAVSGPTSLESIVAIDFRPASGELIALTDASRLYSVNTSTGAAIALGSSAFTPSLSGGAFGLDFNPTVDRLRLVSQADQNLRLHPELGTVVATDTMLAYAAGDVAFNANPSIVGVAYTNSVATATATTLYAIDSLRDTLVRQGSLNGSPSSPNAGLLSTVGSLGVATGDSVGFDISSATGTAYAALQVNGSSTLYSIDLSTGAATSLGAISGAGIVRGLAVGQDLLVYTLPVVGSAAGVNGTAFRSDVYLTNNSASPVGLTIAFYASSASPKSGPTATLVTTLNPGEQRIYRDMVRAQFGIDPGTGALRVTATRPISVRASVYNDQRSIGRGVFGQLIRAYEESERSTSGFLPGLSNNPASDLGGARTNVGFFNPGTSDVTITLTAKSGSGTAFGTATRLIPALAHQQVGLSELFPALSSTDEVYVSYSATSSLFVYASVVDNASGDGMYVRAASTR